MIKLSQKWSYAIKAIIYIANNSDDLVKISDISSSQKISESLLRRIIADLDKSGLIKTTKWRNWWIKLWREINNISTYDILEAIWEDLYVRKCTAGESCNNHEDCTTSNLYWDLQKWLNWILKLYTLDKILKKD